MVGDPVISAWGALVWAYAHENVRAASDRMPEPKFALTDYSSADMGGGTVKGFLACDADAVAIDQFVQAWARVGPGIWFYAQIAGAAEKRTPIPPEIDVQLGRYRIPQLGYRTVKIRGKDELIRCAEWRIHPVSRRPHYTVVDWEGLTPEEVTLRRRKHGELRALFEGLLGQMQGCKYQRWRISGIGA